MRVDIDRLRGEITAKGLTQEQVAREMQISRSTFSRKIHSNALSFTVGEIHKLCRILQLDPEVASKIFFS